MKPIKIKTDIIYDRIDTRMRQIKKFSLSNYNIYNKIDAKLTIGDFMYISDYKEQIKKDICKNRDQD